MDLYWKHFIAIISLLCILGCEPIFVDPNTVGKFVKEELVTKDSISVLAQAYTVPSFDQMRRLIYWCKSENTKNLKTNKENKHKIENYGWRQFSWGEINKLESINTSIVTLGAHRIKIVDNNFIYIDRGNREFSTTFDGCSNINRVFISIGDNLVESKNDLFKNNELSYYPKVESDGLLFPALSGHTHQIIKGTDQYCFNINKVWVVDQNNTYQVCTEDKGKNWYAIRKIGDGKVMKRLAGSEEWVNLE